MPSLEQIQGKILHDYIEDVKKQIILAQDVAQPALVASGNLQSSMKVTVGVHSDRAFLTADNYLATTFQGVGTRAGQVFPYRQLQQWVKFKPRFRDPQGRFLSDKRAAYLVASKIWREGSAVRRGARQGVPINKILRANLPPTGRKLAQAYARDYANDVKKKLE